MRYDEEVGNLLVYLFYFFFAKGYFSILGCRTERCSTLHIRLMFNIKIYKLWPVGYYFSGGNRVVLWRRESIKPKRREKESKSAPASKI